MGMVFRTGRLECTCFHGSRACNRSLQGNASLISHFGSRQRLFALWSQVQAALHGTLGVNAPFVPDMYFGTGGLPVFENRAFSYSRFQDFFRFLLRLPPLGLSQQQACSFSTRSMRRFLPSIADSLQLADSDRLCLGNWSDGRSGTVRKGWNPQLKREDCAWLPSIICLNIFPSQDPGSEFGLWLNI